MKLFGLCLNWKVIVGLAAVAMGLYFVASPAVFKAALPLILAAACPLSMLLMTRFMPHGARPEMQGSAPFVPVQVASAPTPVQD